MFVPTAFSKLGKAASDLLKPPKYELSAKTTNRTACGVKLETTATASGGKLTGQSSATYVNKGWGEVEANLDTSGSVADAKLTYNQIYPDFKASVQVSPRGRNLAQVELNYTPKDFVVATLIGTYRKEQLLGSVSGSIGGDGLSVGGQVEAVYEKDEAKVRDFNVGFQYAGRDFVAALFTKVGREKGGVFQGGNSEDMAISYFHNVSPSYAVAAQFDMDKAKDPVLAFGVDYKIDNQSDFKVIGNTSGDVHTRLTHTLADPRVKIALSSQFDANALSLKSKNFGFAASFGDF
jgi:hypothetical protein